MMMKKKLPSQPHIIKYANWTEYTWTVYSNFYAMSITYNIIRMCII